jgi:PAS domain S-box-containing protein
LRTRGRSALARGEARYRSLFEHSVDAILLTSTDGRILMANPAACRLFGWTADQSAHMRESLADIQIRRRRSHGRRGCVQVSFGGSHLSAEGRGAIGRGKRRLPPSAKGEKKSTVIIRDVTERKRTEAAVLEAQAELARTTRALTVGELAESMSHELNQPLGAIVNNGAACMRLLNEAAGVPAEAREALSEIIEDAQRASAIVARVRKLSNRSSCEMACVRLQDVIDGVLALAQRH